MATCLISPEFAAFLEGGQAVVVATRDASLSPSATRAGGVRVSSDTEVAVFLPKPTSERALRDLRDNGHLAVTVSSPVTLRTFQIKGRMSEIAEATAEDVLWIEEQLRLFWGNVSAFRIGRAQVRNLWMFDCWRVRMRMESLFLQTPGPRAGSRLESGDEPR